MSPYACTVRTASGRRRVQIVYASRRGSRDIEHTGPAHDDAELKVLKAVAWEPIPPTSVSTLRDLAERLSDGRLNADVLSTLPDELMAELTAIPGIGP